MSAFQDFFDYDLMMIACGIPYIILEGSLNDWENVLNKLQFLSKYNFYIKNMEEDIMKIINTKKGKIDLDFWSKIIMETKIKEKHSRPCMFEIRGVENIYIRGWILDFYNEIKIKKKDISDLIPDIVEVPINITEINNFNNKKIKKGIIYAGIRDIKQNPNNNEVEPIVNYEFTFDENQKKIKNEKKDLIDSGFEDDFFDLNDLFG